MAARALWTKAPWTSEAACLKRLSDQWKQALVRAVWLGWATDSINDVGSDDARDGSWHGAVALGVNAKYSPSGVGTRGGENHQADYAAAEADLYMALKKVNGTSKGTGAGPNGFGKQGTYHTAGANRFWDDPTSTGMHAMVKAVGTSARFKVTWDDVVVFDNAASSGNLSWQKIMVGGKTRGQHRMNIIVTAGTVIIDHIYNYDGTETKGVNSFNGGRSGISLQAYSTTGAGGDPQSLFAQYMPLLSQDGKSGMDILVFTIMVNNAGDQDDDVLRYLREQFTVIKEKNPNVTILLTRNPQPTNASEEEWNNRLQIMKQIASEFSNVLVVDMSTLGGDTTMIPRFNYAPELVNTLHPTTLLYTGKGLYQGKPIPYGYAPIMMSFLTGDYWANKTPSTASSGPVTTPPTGTNPPAADTTAPTLAYAAGTYTAGDSIPVGGSVDMFVTATDASGISSGTCVANGRILGSFIQVGSTSTYKFTITWDMIDAIGASANPQPVFRDASTNQNRAELSVRAINRTAPATAPDTTTKPTITDVVISGLTTSGTTVGVAATVTPTVSGATITTVPVNVGNTFVGKLTKQTGSNRWVGELDQKAFVGTDRTYTVTAAQSNGTTQTTGPIAYTVGFTIDTTAPTITPLSPAPLLTLGEQVICQARMQDATGVVLAGFATNNYQFFVKAGDAQLISGTPQDGIWEAIVPRSVITAVNETASVIRAYGEDANGNAQWGDAIQVSVPTKQDDSVQRLWTFLNRETLDWEEEAVKTAFDQRYAAAVVSELAKGVDATKLTGVIDPARIGLTANGTMPLRNSAGILIPIAAGGNATVNTLPIRGVGGVLPGVGAGVALTDAANMAQLNAKPNLIIAAAGTTAAPLLSKPGDLVVVKGN
jgi:hypothetical protein